jgi:ATP-dependent DNA helicase RecG
MNRDFLDTPIEFAKGVGPQRAALLKAELGILTFRDLLLHIPFRYVDRSSMQQVASIAGDTVWIQLLGKIVKVQESGLGNARRLTATLEDESGQIELVWFKGLQWVKPLLQIGEKYLVFGKPGKFKSAFSIVHPELERYEEGKELKGLGFSPVYSTTEKLSARGLNSKGIHKLILNLFPSMEGQIKEFLPLYFLGRFRIPEREEAIRTVHKPNEPVALDRALKRLRFEELLLLQLSMVNRRRESTTAQQGVVFSNVGELFNRFYKEKLPFELTGAQKRVLREIRGDVKEGKHMNRLVQGDVGSGKTIVALLSALMAIDNGYQACLMAPTEILANQHFKGFQELLEGLPVTIELLTGSTKQAGRKRIHEGLKNGSLHILIGTHALIEPAVEFRNLGLAIIDEQHRFGVEQRARLWKKAPIPPHVLVMTATPIPRTLAMTLYGDLDLSIIDELPPGRKPVKTMCRTDADRLQLFGFIEQQIRSGRQIYVVYPLIETSETMDYKDLMDGYESICRRFSRPDYQVSIVHGKMHPEAKEFEMARFLRKETQIMVATTVIEVGVNVPNASVMVIESAERFGLSQLHQLRGRVGRGADLSYCILMTHSDIGKEARRRLETMVSTNDGFKIAEVDMELRGPGDILGTQQSGLPEMKVADLTRDKEIHMAARDCAEELFLADVDLSLPEHMALKMEWIRTKASRSGWSRIS